MLARPRLAIPHRVALAALAALAACGKPSFDRRQPPGRAAGQSCAKAADCRQGLTCVAGVCSPSVGAGACPAAPVAIALGAPVVPDAQPAAPADPPCALPVREVAASFPPAQVQELRHQPVGAALQFQVPPGTAGLSIVAQEVDGSAPEQVTFTVNGKEVAVPNAVAPTDLYAPGIAGKFYDDLAALPADPSGALAEYVGFVPAVGAMTLPNTSAALDLVRSGGGLPAGTWRFTLTDTARECPTLGCTVPGGAGNGVYDVKVLTRPWPLGATGAIDADVYLVSDDPARPTLTAADAVADPAANPTARQFRRFVDQLAQHLAQGGVCLGTVRVHEVPAWARALYHDLDIARDGACAPMGQLFTLAAPERGVHLFLVDSLVTGSTSTGGAVVVGIDGSIPGPSAVPGTTNGGAAVVLADLGQEAAAGACAGNTDLARCGTDLVAYVAAHEAGHWLGLYHVTEASGTLFDPLTDTATCACSSCAAASQRALCGSSAVRVFASACAAPAGDCSGGQNLMFWLVDPTVSLGALSPQQGEVMRANPLVR